MNGRLIAMLAIAGISVLAMSGCGGGETPEDSMVTQDLILPDFGNQDTNAGDTTGDVRPDVVTTDEGQPDTTDEGTPDTAADEGPVDTGYDPGQPDLGPEDTYVPPYFECNSLDDCQPYEVCDLALGRCEERSSYPLIVGNEDLFTFKPPEGGYGDFVVIDGSRFRYDTMNTTVRADIGGSLVASSTLVHSTISPHRIIGPVPNEGGKVGVVFQQATPVYQKFTEEFIYNGNLGELPCDDSTPPATGSAGVLGEVGQYAAGYVDLVSDDVRIYYPAECGSIRRPAVAGTYPVAIIIPEGADVSVPFLNFDYIGQILASWGIVTVSLKAEVDTENAEAHLLRVINTVPGFVNADLGTRHAVLDGVHTSDKMAWIVFGSGALTLSAAAVKEEGSAIKNLAIAAVAIAPSAKLQDIGASSFMAFYGDLDKIANNSFADSSYDEFNSPRWKVEIKGGNHSLFTDHQMYYGGGIGAVTDNDPEIMRKDQMTLTISMLLPFLQRAFGLAEPFSGQLQQSFSNDKISVTKG